MKITPPKVETYLKSKSYRSSRVSLCKNRKGIIRNYMDTWSLEDHLYNRMEKKRYFYTHQWDPEYRDDYSKPLSTIRHNVSRIANERKEAYKHHYYQVIVHTDKRGYRNQSVDVPEVTEWCKENSKGDWQVSVEMVFEEDDLVLYFVYWFKEKEDAFLCKLTFGCP